MVVLSKSSVFPGGQKFGEVEAEADHLLAAAVMSAVEMEEGGNLQVKPVGESRLIIDLQSVIESDSLSAVVMNTIERIAEI